MLYDGKDTPYLKHLIAAAFGAYLGAQQQPRSTGPRHWSTGGTQVSPFFCLMTVKKIIIEV